MKRVLFFLVLIFFAGCLTRHYITEQPRVDLEVEGNQGYLFGEPPETVREFRLGKTRKVAVWEVELGAHELVKKEEEVYEAPPETVYEEVEDVEDYSEDIEEVEDDDLYQPETSYARYTVQKNDTLQKISRKFYGTTRKWMMLYEENKDVLKSPDKVYPGMVLRIPELD